LEIIEKKLDARFQINESKGKSEFESVSLGEGKSEFESASFDEVLQITGRANEVVTEKAATVEASPSPLLLGCLNKLRSAGRTDVVVNEMDYALPNSIEAKTAAPMEAAPMEATLSPIKREVSKFARRKLGESRDLEHDVRIVHNPFLTEQIKKFTRRARAPEPFPCFISQIDKEDAVALGDKMHEDPVQTIRAIVGTFWYRADRLVFIDNFGVQWKIKENRKLFDFQLRHHQDRKDEEEQRYKPELTEIHDLPERPSSQKSPQRKSRFSAFEFAGGSAIKDTTKAGPQTGSESTRRLKLLRNFVHFTRSDKILLQNPSTAYPLQAHWKWMAGEEANPISYCEYYANRLWFMYRGMVNNESLRASALSTLSLTAVMRDRVVTLRNDYRRLDSQKLGEEDRRRAREVLDHKGLHLLMSLDSLFDAAVRHPTSQGYIRINTLMRMAGVPFNSACSTYIRHRDRVLSVPDNDVFRHEMLVLLARTVANLNTLCNYTMAAIDRNDELWFRIIVLCMNAAIVIGMYFRPPEWKRQIASLYDAVVCNVVQECNAL
jgi:hypothetical protein